MIKPLHLSALLPRKLLRNLLGQPLHCPDNKYTIKTLNIKPYSKMPTPKPLTFSPLVLFTLASLIAQLIKNLPAMQEIPI